MIVVYENKEVVAVLKNGLEGKIFIQGLDADYYDNLNKEEKRKVAQFLRSNLAQ